MNRVVINLEPLKYNLTLTNDLMRLHGGRWTLVTKVLCGHKKTIKALKLMGVESIGDSRISNLHVIEDLLPAFESWYLRVPNYSSIPDVVELADISLNSETGIIEALNEEAGRKDKIHNIIIMIELGDLREGILPGTLIKFYQHVFELSNINVIGIGSNLGCLAGVVPSNDQFMQLALYRELLELKFDRKLPLISGGSTASLPLLLNKEMPKAINHFRIGEAIFLGTDLINGGTLPGYRSDAILLEAEIVEIKEKRMTPQVETSSETTPFEKDEEDQGYSPGERGYRALINIGELDTALSGLTPIDPNHRIVGASSDITVVSIGDHTGGLNVGDLIKFRVNYSALLRLMSSKYIKKEINPPLDNFEKMIDREQTRISPSLKEEEKHENNEPA